MRFLLLSLIGITLISCSKTSEYRAAMKDDTTRMSVQTGNPLQIVRSDSVTKAEKNKIDPSPDTATFEMDKGQNKDHEIAIKMLYTQRYDNSGVFHVAAKKKIKINT